jgi:hypothetical protein
MKIKISVKSGHKLPSQNYYSSIKILTSYLFSSDIDYIIKIGNYQLT